MRVRSTRATVMQPPQPGWHIGEWLAECGGTAVLLFAGVSVICLDFGARSPVARAIPSESVRLLITGLLFAGAGSLVVISPLGRRSGGHLNPAVTLAFRITGHVHQRDLAGYAVAQCAGALLGVALARLLWRSTAVSVHNGGTAPGPTTGMLPALALEAAMTALLVLTVMVFVSRRELMRWTPLAVWILVALLVWRVAPLTGTSLNPARSLGPALINGDVSVLWIYIAGPLAGAAAVALLVRLLPWWHPLTAKLMHDGRYPCVFACALDAGELALSPGVAATGRAVRPRSAPPPRPPAAPSRP